MESLAAAAAVIMLLVWSIGPAAVFAAQSETVPDSIVLFLAAGAVAAGIWWWSLATGARWMACVPFILGVWSILKRFF